MSCSAEEDFTHSTRVEVCCSAFRESCSAATSFAICFVVCSAAGCSGLVGVGVAGVWTDDEEILLKIFVWRPQRSCSSSESSSSIITAREEVEMVNYAGMVGCTGLGNCTKVREVKACRPEP